MATQIKIRRGTSAQWTSANPILAEGEQGFESDTKKIKIGDGVTAWNSLAYFNKSISELDTAYEPKNLNIQSHISNTSNPHSVTKGQVGLDNVDNTSDADKPISTATQSALDLKANASNVYSKSEVFTKTESNSNFEPKNANIQSHISNLSNPHSVTKSQVGLGNADNTSDIDKPVSSATQTALNLKANSDDVYSKSQVDSFDASILSSANSYTDTKVAQVVNSAPATLDTLNELAAALGNDPNFATTTATLIGTKADSSSVYTKTQSDTNFEPKNSNIQSHISNLSNPHDVTKAQVGLGSVDNVSAASLRDRSTHTGTQLASTISDFTNAVQSVTIDASQIDGGVVSNTEFSYLDGVTSSVQTQLNGKANITGGNTFTGKQVLTPTVTTSGLNIGSVSTDPSALVNADIWYNSTSNDIKFRKNGVTINNLNILNVQVITSGTSYTPTSGTKYIDAILVGGGGGGGGVSGAGTSIGVAGGGGGGAVLRIFTALPGAASYTIAIGTGGAGGTAGANNGSNGTATTLSIGASTYSAQNGNGGTGQTAGTAAANVSGGSGGTLPTGGTLNVAGQAGHGAIRVSGVAGLAGRGADSMFGSGGISPSTAQAGNNATGYGAGGSGGYSTAATNRAGGNGSPGVIVITEYA